VSKRSDRPEDMVPFMLRRSRLLSLAVETFPFGEGSPPEREFVSPRQAAEAMRDGKRVRLI